MRRNLNEEDIEGQTALDGLERTVRVPKLQKLQEVQEPKQSIFNPKLKPMELQELQEEHERYQYNRWKEAYYLNRSAKAVEVTNTTKSEAFKSQLALLMKNIEV